MAHEPPPSHREGANGSVLLDVSNAMFVFEPRPEALEAVRLSEQDAEADS